MGYVIRFWYRGQVDEYEGGKTLVEARKEAAFFRKHVPSDQEIHICKLKEDGSADSPRPYLVEVL